MRGVRPRAARRGRADDRDHARRHGRRPRRDPARRAAPPARLPGRSRQRADRADQPRGRVALRTRSSSPRRAASACPGSRWTSSGRCTPASAGSTSTASRSQIEASGLEARVLQHEIDHLDGVLILDRAPRAQRKGALRALREGEQLQPAAGRAGGRRRGRASRAAHRRVRTVYLGTSEFAATVLRRLADSPHRPLLVVTPPDRPKGRGRRTPSPPAAEAARELGIELLQAADVNDDERAGADPRRAARGGRRLRLRPADPRAAALRVADAQRPPLAAAALARRGADRAGDHGRRASAPASA